MQEMISAVFERQEADIISFFTNNKLTANQGIGSGIQISQQDKQKLS
jgi:hypothetical protein